MKNRILRFFGSAVLLLPALLPAGDAAYWREAQTVRAGVLLKELSFDEPRLMKAFALRVDLQTPGIGFVSTERAARWGEPMPDYTNKVVKICTKRERTTDFMTRLRRAGKNVCVAINTAPWGPWCPPWTHAWANPGRWVVSDGVEVCAGKTPGAGALFVVRKDGRAAITSFVPPAERADVAHAHPGFSIIATNGVALVDRQPRALHPRTAFGLSRDGRYLYLLVVDGRQPGYSLGANLGDLCRMLLPAGAADIVNMDGGGSTSLVLYDPATGRARMLNRHARNSQRTVALNFGITF